MMGCLESVSKWQHVRAMLGGDFTPLHVAQIDFTSLRLADGLEIQLQTVPSEGSIRCLLCGLGRTLGGSLEFGLLGTIAAQSSRTVGAAFGYYGLARSVFSTVVARGQEVQFDKNAVIDICFNARDGKTEKSNTAAKRE